MLKRRIGALVVLLIAAGIGYFVYSSGKGTTEVPASHPFSLGLDLSGGTRLVYRADVAAVAGADVKDSMDALRDVIERRVNLFGVSEPIVQVQRSGFSSSEERLIVELPGVTDIKKATDMIGQTPLLEFRTQAALQPAKIVDGQLQVNATPVFEPTALNGKYLEKALLEFDQNTGKPIISLHFNTEGAALFEKITTENVGKVLAIYLDGQPISTPVVNGPISGGKAVISGDFTPQEAKLLVGRLNSGALPVPISLISTQAIGATLGESAINAGMKAAFVGFLAVALFLIFWYRLPGVVGVLTLATYLIITLALYKLIPVTLTAAGIAGFIISIGMAVDANILIFERFKEELQKGRSVKDAIANGFGRAWDSVRDANTSTLITAIILFWFGTSLIKGFALTLGLGVVVSLLCAVTASRILLRALPQNNENRFVKFLFGSGLTK